MREQCINSDKQYMNSEPCEVTVHAQKKKEKSKKKGKTWNWKRNIHLNPNTHYISLFGDPICQVSELETTLS